MNPLSPKTKWVRDVEVSSIIEYFDRPEKSNWNLLKAKEIGILMQELDRCRQDFTYAARNYFWIETKDKDTVLFRLWDSQELILDRMNWLRSRGKPQKVMVIKARRLGCSTLIEAIMLWSTIFFPNTHGLVVTYDEKHAVNVIWKIPQFILDHLPWWMRPMFSSRKQADGVVFDNEDYENRVVNPGLNSSITVDWANKVSSVGRGYTITSFHASEFALWNPRKMKQIIQEEVGPAISNNVHSFGVLESTPYGAGSAGHSFWRQNVELGERAEWLPIFLPYFVDKANVMAPPGGWRVHEEEENIRIRAERDWVKCDYKLCARFHERFYGGRDISGQECKFCSSGVFRPLQLEDPQLYWMEHYRINREHDKDSLRKLRQEFASNPEEAWVLSGTPLFSESSIEWSASRVDHPVATGFFDVQHRFHGVKDVETGECWCEDCTANHEYDDCPLRIYEWPKEGGEYYIGADVGEGIGEDYSAACVIKKGGAGEADRQAAVFASNTISPYEYAEALNSLGHFYKDAVLAVEKNVLDHVVMLLRVNLQYPNLYMQRSQTSAHQSISGVGWKTSGNNKADLWSLLRRWLDAKLIDIKDSRTVDELKTFRKDDPQSQKAGAARTFFDDLVMALMIALFIAHEDDWDENAGMIPIKREITFANCRWIMYCAACESKFPANSPNDKTNCPACGSMRLEYKETAQPSGTTVYDVDYEGPVFDVVPETERKQPDYELL